MRWERKYSDLCVALGSSGDQPGAWVLSYWQGRGGGGYTDGCWSILPSRHVCTYKHSHTQSIYISKYHTKLIYAFLFTFFIVFS